MNILKFLYPTLILDSNICDKEQTEWPPSAEVRDWMRRMGVSRNSCSVLFTHLQGLVREKPLKCLNLHPLFTQSLGLSPCQMVLCLPFYWLYGKNINKSLMESRIQKKNLLNEVIEPLCAIGHGSDTLMTH